MEQFNLTEWLQDKSRKVVTREGKPVRIVCWDSPNKGFPIVGFIDDNPTVFIWDKYGYALPGHRESNRDLFFADNDELTEFEKAMIQFSHERNSLIQFEHTTEEINAHLYLYSEKLLDLARKELEKDNVIIDKDKYLEICDQYYNNGKQNALKDLPKWKKTVQDYYHKGNIPCTNPIISGDEEYLIVGTYEIKISDLETLPKEE